MGRDVKELVRQMTLEEKAGMCSGKDFWYLKAIDRLGIPSVMVSDGPHGLRKQAEEADHLGINDSIKAVCFPAACATACSFDRDLLESMGVALGEECQAENVSVLLGPAVNIKRSPLCGRNFEYFSEDPYLASQMAKSHINGVQSKNIGTSIKHFAANNQEFRRMTSSSEADERTFREIYLAAFETAVKDAKPYTVMCSYNKINGVFASENPYLLTEILRDEWGFEGYVMSDWGAVNDRVEALKAGLELEMPASKGITDAEIVAAVKDGSLEEAVLNQAVERILNIVFKYVDNRIACEFDRDKHHELAQKVAEESIVLLKNEDILPLGKTEKVAFIGEYASKPRIQGGGSSHINTSKVTSALDAVKDRADVTYAQGYGTTKDEVDEALVKEAVEAAKAADKAILFIGLPDAFESEGYDRKHMNLPECQNYLVNEVLKVQDNVIVVLHNGSPVEMPWIDQVKGIVEVYLGGQAIGGAVVNVLYGEVNPCGKLAETFPKKLSDNPSYLNFPGTKEAVEYKEGVFVGYRYYDTKEMDVLFPFGYGLSYTTFEYSDLQIDKETFKDTDTVEVTLKVKNTGAVAGKEIVQLYVSDKTNAVARPLKELKNFVKVELAPGEEKTVSMALDKRSFAWYNTKISDWYAASGEYEILVGKSAAEIVLKKSVQIESTTILPITASRNSTIGDLIKDERSKAIIEPLFAEMMSAFGGESDDSGAVNSEMAMSMVDSMPLRTLRSFGGVSNEMIDGIVEQINKLN